MRPIRSFSDSRISAAAASHRPGRRTPCAGTSGTPLPTGQCVRPWSCQQSRGRDHRARQPRDDAHRRKHLFLRNEVQRAPAPARSPAILRRRHSAARSRLPRRRRRPSSPPAARHARCPRPFLLIHRLRQHRHCGVLAAQHGRQLLAHLDAVQLDARRLVVGRTDRWRWMCMIAAVCVQCDAMVTIASATARTAANIPDFLAEGSASPSVS